jgi:hypothetical protein
MTCSAELLGLIRKARAFDVSRCEYVALCSVEGSRPGLLWRIHGTTRPQINVLPCPNRNAHETLLNYKVKK